MAPRRHRVAAMIAGAAVIAAGVGIPAIAHAVGTTDLTVHVTSKAGTPLTGLDVWAKQISDPSSYPLTGPISFDPSADTHAAEQGTNGDYSLSLSTAFQYEIVFDTFGASSFDQIYPGVSITDPAHASVLAWGPGDHTLSASLQTYSTLSGKLTDSKTKKGVSKAGVTAYRYNGSDWVAAQIALTDSKGAYTFADLDPASYRVGFTAPTGSSYQSSFVGGATLASATSYWVGLGKKVTVNSTLHTGGSLAGKLLYTDGTLNGIASGIEVHVAPFVSATGHPDWSTQYTATSTSTGAFTVTGLPDGQYVARTVDTRTNPQPFRFAGKYLTDPSWTLGGHLDNGGYSLPVFTVSGGKKITASTLTLTPANTGAAPSLPYTVKVWEPGCDLGDIGACTPAVDATVTLRSQVSDSSAGGSYTATTDATGVAQFQGVWADDYIVQASADDSALVAQEASTADAVGGLLAQVVLTDPIDPLDLPFDFTCERPLDGTSDCSATAGKVGDVLDVSSTVIDAPAAIVAAPADYRVAYRYQWYRVGGDSVPQPIFGATSAQYTVQSTDIGKLLRVVVTASADGQQPVQTADDFGIGQGPQPSFTQPPLIIPAGTSLASAPGDFNAVAGAKLAVAYQLNTTDGLTPEYHWLDAVSSSEIGTGPTYTVTNSDADSGRPIIVALTFSGDAYAGTPFDTSANTVTSVPHSGLALKKAPTVSTKKAGGLTQYTVSKGTWTPSGTTPSYQWFMASDPVGTGSSLTPPADGTGVWVVVTASKAGYGSASTVVHVRKAAQDLIGAGVPDTAPDITLTPAGGSPEPGADSTPNVGDVLAATPVVFTPGDSTGTLSAPLYQWQRSVDDSGIWTNISKATKAAYTVTLADVGAKLRAQVTQKSQGYADTVYQTAATDAVPLSPALADGAEPLLLPAAGTGIAGSAISFVVLGPFPVKGATAQYTWEECSGVTADCSDGSWSTVATASSPKYLTPVTEIGHAFRMGYTVSKPGYADYTTPTPTAWTGPGGALLLDPATATGPVFTSVAKITVGSPAAYGQKLTTAVGTTAQKSKSAYQWYQCASTDGGSTCPTDAVLEPDETNVYGHWIPVAGATSTTLTTTPAMWVGGSFDLNLELVQTATAGGLSTTLRSAPVAVNQQGAVHNIQLPTVVAVKSGTTVTGWTVTKPGTWTPSGTGCSIFYAWSVSGHTVDGSAFDAHLDASQIEGYDPTVGVTIDVGMACNGFTQANVELIAQKQPFEQNPYGSLFDTPQVGVGLTFPTPAPEFGNPDSLTTKYSYQWYRGSAKLTKNGGTSQTYTPQASDVGQKLKVVVTASNPRYASASITTSYPIAVTKGDLSGLVPTCDCDEPQVGDTLAVAVPTSIPSVSWTVAWQTKPVSGGDWTTVQSGSKRTYLVPASQYGRLLQAVVTAKKSGYTTVQTPLASLAPIDYTGEIEAVTPPLLADPAQSGTAAVGTAVSIGTPAAWSTTGVALTYQWLRDGVPIPGATASTFTPESDFVGAALAVSVTAHRSGYLDGVITSSNTLTVGAGAAPAILSGTKNQPKITLGDPGADVAATASTGVWSLGGLTFHYQWYVAPAGTTSFTPLSDGTDTPQLMAADVVSAIGAGSVVAYVTVSASARGHSSSAAVQSATTAPFTVGP